MGSIEGGLACSRIRNQPERERARRREAGSGSWREESGLGGNVTTTIECSKVAIECKRGRCGEKAAGCATGGVGGRYRSDSCNAAGAAWAPRCR
jgi:hypothetical protein